MVTADLQNSTTPMQSTSDLQNQSGNQSTLRRLVGFHEYGQAIDMLDELVRISTSEEVAVYDKLFRLRPEFTIYTNLSSLIDEQPNSFSIVSASGSQNDRHGIAWVMALARLELFAMVSVYGNEHQLTAMRPPSTLEQDAFRDLLIDGMRMHIGALIGDERYTRVRDRNPDSEMIAYVRRMTLVARIVQTVASLYSEDLTARQRDQLSVWNHDIEEQRNGLLEKIYDYLARTKKRVVTDSEFQSCMQDCAIQLKSIGVPVRR